jgi:GNAT superfamily N-acetyltransferase
MTTVPDGYHDLPPGKIAAVVTFLEMFGAPPPRAVPDGHPFTLARWTRPDPARYLALYRKVGENWLWFSRTAMGEAALAAIIHDPRVEVFALVRGEEEIGLLELDFRDPDSAEIAYFGVVESFEGTSAARFMMGEGLARVWSRRPAPRRLFVHTCTLDHPRAVAFYQRSGFTPYKRAVEIADDPRLSPGADRQAAGWFPVIAPDAGT